MCRHVCEKPAHPVPPPGAFNFENHPGTSHPALEEELVRRQKGVLPQAWGEGALLAAGAADRPPKSTLSLLC